jgi:hypothetical protein
LKKKSESESESQIQNGLQFGEFRVSCVYTGRFNPVITMDKRIRFDLKMKISKNIVIIKTLVN